MSIIRIQNIYCVAANVPANRTFYETVLGLNLKFGDGDRWLQFAVHSSNFSIASEAEATCPSPAFVPVFEVSDLQFMKTQLESNGVEVFAERDMGFHGRTFAARDPGGNVLQFFEKAASQLTLAS